MEMVEKWVNEGRKAWCEKEQQDKQAWVVVSVVFLKGSSFSSSVRSSGKWNVSRISSGVFPSIIRAKALLVKSTNAFI